MDDFEYRNVLGLVRRLDKKEITIEVFENKLKDFKDCEDQVEYTNIDDLPTTEKIKVW